jgi:hypothetical protein
MTFHVRFVGNKNLPGPETFWIRLLHTLCNVTTITISTSTQRTEPVLLNDGVSLSKQVTCLLPTTGSSIRLTCSSFSVGPRWDADCSGAVVHSIWTAWPWLHRLPSPPSTQQDEQQCFFVEIPLFHWQIKLQSWELQNAMLRTVKCSVENYKMQWWELLNTVDMQRCS